MSKENDTVPHSTGEVAWNYIGIDADPPRGSKIWMLTAGNIAISGIWDETAGHKAWSPLLKRNRFKEKLLAGLRAGTIVRVPVKYLKFSEALGAPGGFSVCLEVVSDNELAKSLHAIGCYTSTVAYEITINAMPPYTDADYPGWLELLQSPVLFIERTGEHELTFHVVRKGYRTNDLHAEN